eukprot:sb/3461712/
MVVYLCRSAVVGPCFTGARFTGQDPFPLSIPVNRGPKLIDDWESSQRCYTMLPRVLQYLTDKYCNTGDTVAVLLTEEHLEQMTQLPQEQVDEIVMDKNVVCVTPSPQSVVGMIQFCPKFNTHEDNIHIIIDFANTRKPRISEAVANGQSIDLLVAPTVQKYIKEKQLYDSDFLNLSPPGWRASFYLRVGILFSFSRPCFFANLVKSKFYDSQNYALSGDIRFFAENNIQIGQNKVLRTPKIMLFPLISGFLPKSESKWGLSRPNTTPRDKWGVTTSNKNNCIIFHNAMFPRQPFFHDHLILMSNAVVLATESVTANFVTVTVTSIGTLFYRGPIYRARPFPPEHPGKSGSEAVSYFLLVHITQHALEEYVAFRCQQAPPTRIYLRPEYICSIYTYFSLLRIDDWESSQRCYTMLPRVLQYLTDKYCNTGDTVAVLLTEEHLEQMTQLPQEQVDEIVMDKNVVCVTPSPQSVVGMIQFCPKFNTHEDNIHIIIDFANTRKPRISEAVANGQSIDLLVAPTVQKYIKEKQLYETDVDREISAYNLSVQELKILNNLVPITQFSKIWTYYILLGNGSTLYPPTITSAPSAPKSLFLTVSLSSSLSLSLPDEKTKSKVSLDTRDVLSRRVWKDIDWNCLFNWHYCVYKNLVRRESYLPAHFSINMIRLVVLSTLILVATSSDFAKWQLKYKGLQAYSSPEQYKLRETIWRDNAAYVAWYNSLDTGITLEVNQFADMTHNEFKDKLRTRSNSLRAAADAAVEVDLSGKGAPASRDWRKEGAVSEVKNQGDCGSCYAFAAVGAIEGQLAQKKGKVTSLSEQQIVDCCPTTGGCDGGMVEDVFNFLKTTGLASEKSYPYTGQEGSCKSGAAGVVKVVSWAKVRKYKEAELMAAVGNIGPVSVGIDAGERSMMFYKEGIYSDPMCMTSRIDHGVLVVGYGTEKGKDYWIVKNSWGPVWDKSRLKKN